MDADRDAVSLTVGDALLRIQGLKDNRRYKDIVAITSGFAHELLVSQPILLLAHAGSLSNLRRHPEAKVALEFGEAAIRATRDPVLYSNWCLLLGIQHLHTDGLLKGTAYLEESIAAAGTVRNSRVIADASNSLGVIHSFRGEVEEAITLFYRALYAWRQLGDSRGVGMAHHNIGMVLRDWGSAQAAQPHFEEADAFYEREGIIEERVNLRSERALLHADLGDLSLADRLASQAINSLTHVSSQAVAAAAHRAAGIIHQKSGDHSKAISHLGTALAALGGETAGILRAEILEELAIALGETADPKAPFYLRQAIEAYGRLGSTRHQSRLLHRFSRH